jgi:hypothetical protein
MARHQVLFTSRGPSVFRNVRRTEQGLPFVVLDNAGTASVVLDLTDYLDSGETVSSATVSATGVTCAASVSSPNVTLAISEPQGQGDIEVTITLSSGAKWAGTLMTREQDYPTRPQRYR